MVLQLYWSNCLSTNRIYSKTFSEQNQWFMSNAHFILEFFLKVISEIKFLDQYMWCSKHSIYAFQNYYSLQSISCYYDE